MDEAPGADRKGGHVFLGVDAGDFGEEVGLGDALFAGVGGGFAAGEKVEMLLRAGAEEPVGGKPEQALLRADDGGQGLVVAGIFPQVRDLCEELPELVDQPEYVVALL